MTNDGIVNIHGKDYMTVAKRVELVHEDHKGKSLNITTRVLLHEPVVVIKATVLTTNGKFTGISAANPAKAIEKQNPYEVAETSAVGRALGFAGYGIVEGIASADEMVKAGATPQPGFKATEAQWKMIYALGNSLNFTSDDLDKMIVAKFNLKVVDDLTKSQASQVIDGLQKKEQDENAMTDAQARDIEQM